MYKAIRYFTDLKDGSYPYHPGDVFPREGLQVSDERIEELSTGNNRRGIPVIELVKVKKAEKPKEEPKVEEPKAEPKVEAEEPKTEEAPKPKRTRKKKDAD